MFLQETTGLAPPEVIWPIVGICIVMSLLSQWFTKKYAVPASEQMQLQMKIQDLQMRMKDARGDQEMMMQMNQEMMVLMKLMYKKQLIPMMLRSIIWIALFGLLRLLFGGYDEYLPFGFILEEQCSPCISLFPFVIR